MSERFDADQSEVKATEVTPAELNPTESGKPDLVPVKRTRRLQQGEKLRDGEKVERIPVKVIASDQTLRKPDWIRVKVPSVKASKEVERIKSILRSQKLATVCEEASCPNLGECFSGGTATFMIMGEICTRRCPFCDVGHGKPNPLDPNEPQQLAEAIAAMSLRYVVITSVDRDDLRDGGAEHFAECIKQSRALSPNLQVEILTPDFRGRMDVALDVLEAEAPDVFNHNLETVPRLYRESRPGANYKWSLKLLQEYKKRRPDVLTKSGLMVGLGETKEEIFEVLDDMRAHDIDMLTVGQYLQPSKEHLPVQRYVHPDEFEEYRVYAEKIGFKHAACGPMVRSSYHADKQAHGEEVK
ncbi:lipoyl synthase [Microbulbifer agarilyticus]|uniref:lipoyl synthase n=1 Tax=Microbulbifer agarilyticus TaxID=260552 RepID=UPI001CD3BFEB|nr:lipoyl synthase [Microbulbifer agarilyticus]MCA0893064.1 lipoyl synthase [Microbulbifer agarilyticus]